MAKSPVMTKSAAEIHAEGGTKSLMDIPGVGKAIAEKTEEFIRNIGRPPRVILMENHGIITLGRSVEAVLSAMLMAEKAAGVWLGAAALGGPKFMAPENVARISGRPDEMLRRKMLKL